MDATILLIEDEDDHFFIISEHLKNKGFDNLVHCTSGEDGVKKALEIKPDVVITDTQLPGIDGFEVCKRIKIENPSQKVIIITGHARAVDFPKAREVQANEYTVKTANCEELVWKLRQCIRKS